MVCHFKMSNNGVFEIIREFHEINLSNIYYQIRFRNPYIHSKTKEGYFFPKSSKKSYYNQEFIMWVYDVEKDEYWIDIDAFDQHHTRDMNKIEGERYFEVLNLFRFSFWYKRQKKISYILEP